MEMRNEYTRFAGLEHEHGIITCVYFAKESVRERLVPFRRRRRLFATPHTPPAPHSPPLRAVL